MNIYKFFRLCLAVLVAFPETMGELYQAFLKAIDVFSGYLGRN